MIKLGIAGASGKMGQAIIRLAGHDKKVQVSAGLVSKDSINLGADLGRLVGADDFGVMATDDVNKFLAESDVIIDFTRPEITTYLLKSAAEKNRPIVSGTTGLSKHDKSILSEAAEKIPVVWSANMSLGVNILASLVEKTAAVLREEFDIEISEMHHRAKVDAPSGTAILLGEAAARGRKTSLEKAKVAGRDGVTGPRKSGEIGFAVLRGGDVVGEHTVMFAGNGERIELTHKASSREIFAKGSIEAAKWLYSRPAGLYSMADVLAL